MKTAPMEDPTTTHAAIPIDPSRKPFTPEDIDLMEQGFTDVGDYAERIPAWSYKCWALEEYALIYFFKSAEAQDAFLCLATDDTIAGYTEGDIESFAALPDHILSAPAHLNFIEFPLAGTAITPPRGIKIGDPAQSIFDAYPDHRRAGQEDRLYDITHLYPEETVNASNKHIGGHISSPGSDSFYVSLVYAELESHELVAPLRMDYWVQENIICGIDIHHSFDF